MGLPGKPRRLSPNMGPAPKEEKPGDRVRVERTGELGTIVSIDSWKFMIKLDSGATIVEHPMNLKIYSAGLCLHQGAVYVAIRPSVGLPRTYSTDERTAVELEASVAARALVNVLQPSKKPAEDFGHALGFAIEALCQAMQDDPAVRAVPMTALPKQLRTR